MRLARRLRACPWDSPGPGLCRTAPALGFGARVAGSMSPFASPIRAVADKWLPGSEDVATVWGSKMRMVVGWGDSIRQALAFTV